MAHNVERVASNLGLAACDHASAHRLSRISTRSQPLYPEKKYKLYKTVHSVHWQRGHQKNNSCLEPVLHVDGSEVKISQTKPNHD